MLELNDVARSFGLLSHEVGVSGEARKIPYILGITLNVGPYSS